MTGGNPEMTLRRFIDIAFAILVEEYQRLGTDLLTAIERVGLLGMPDVDDVAPVPKPIDNAAAMETLMGMMGGVKGAPV